jgi:IclR-like helix-turn-helix domain-containing protein
VLLCIAHDPGARLRDIAASLGITERSAHAIVADLAEASYVVKHKDGRRNRYQVRAHLPLAEPGTREPAVGEVLALLLGTPAGRDEPRAMLPRDGRGTSPVPSPSPTASTPSSTRLM